ncbi:MAG TPA: efflux RND transporter permease subunit [Longimicrobium sp.]
MRAATPLVAASGAGAASRRSLSTGVFFGMLRATVIGVFFIPLFFTVIRGLVEGRRPARPAALPSLVPVHGD